MLPPSPAATIKFGSPNACNSCHKDKDAAWAERGIDALRQQGFGAAELSVIVRDGPDAASFVQRVTGQAPERFDLATVGAAVGRGTLVTALRASALT